MLAFRVMEALRRGHGGGFLAFCAAFVAFQCGQEQFDLLSTGQPSGGSSASGGPGATGGAAHSGGSGSLAGGRSNEPKPPLSGCNHNDQCREQSPWAPFCVDDRCVQCRDTQSCPEGLSCDRGVCRLPCKDDECPEWGHCLTDRDVCVECRTGIDCDASVPHCLNNYCRGCRNESDCGKESPFCINNYCRQCWTESDCRPQSPLCINNSCRQCWTDSDCADELPACVENFCRECDWAGDCAPGQQCSIQNECCSPNDSGCLF
jgi:hypothetical protein